MSVPMHPDTAQYNSALAEADAEICHRLAQEINRALPEAFKAR